MADRARGPAVLDRERGLCPVSWEQSRPADRRPGCLPPSPPTAHDIVQGSRQRHRK